MMRGGKARWYDDGHNQKSEGLTEHLIFDGSIWEHYYTTNAALGSRETRSVDLPLSAEWKMLSRVRRIGVSVD